jgi:hypothetical protein
VQFIIKPIDNSLYLVLEANEYRSIWQQHARKLRFGFRAVTGLDFRQRAITAHVCERRGAAAGSYHRPMQLPANPGATEGKLVTLVHELSHRLLTGNGLRITDFGIEDIAGKDTAKIRELQHRLIYLFEYDVMHRALGEAGGRICQHDEEQYRGYGAGSYLRAWRWAMGLTFEQRQHCLQWLRLHAEAETLNSCLAGKIVAGEWLRQLDKIAKEHQNLTTS